MAYNIFIFILFYSIAVVPCIGMYNKALKITIIIMTLLLLFLSSGLATADCISFIAFQIFSNCCCVSVNSDFTVDRFRLGVFFSDGGPDEPKSSQS